MNLEHSYGLDVLPDTNLVDRLRYWAEQQPAAPAFYFVDEHDREFKLTYEELDRRARTVAAHLSQLGMKGERALLMFPPGLEFVAAFFGCLYAGAVAVPAFAPRRNRKVERIEAISDDAQASIVLTVQEVTNRCRDHVEIAPGLKELKWLSTDELSGRDADDWRAPPLGRDALAVLQYTSGSTGTPKGVQLSHGNLMHNCAAIRQGFEVSIDAVGLSWLPTYHDMGLVGGVLKPVYCGRPSVLLSPMSFLQRPVRWLRAITRYRATISGGPNFAYALCNDKISPEECEGLDLSSWQVAYNGAEPVRADTLSEFSRRFAPYGFRPEAHYPCYGMAETTLIVTGAVKQERPVVQTFDAKSLERHEATTAHEGAPGARTLVGCGRPLADQRVLIVEPESRRQLPDGQVGEIWVTSPSVGAGYWNRAEETERTFRARLADSPDNSVYLRTGDLGLFHNGELFVTGRSKDLIIIRGRNLYPHDIEASVGGAHPALRSGGSAAFSVDEDNEEKLVILQEVDRHHPQFDSDEVVAAICEAVLRDHEVSPSTVVLLRAAKLLKTSSGKIQRRACRDAFLRGKIESLVKWHPGQEPKAAAESATDNRLQLTDKSQATVQAWLVDRIAKRLSKPGSQIDVRAAFESFGLDSMALVEISGELEDWLGRTVSPTLLFNYPTIAALADYLAPGQDGGLAGGSLGLNRAEGHAPPRGATSGASREAIAIVGLGCRFPGADSPDELWQLLRDRGDAIKDIPADRWEVDEFYDPDPEIAGKMYSRRGGFLRQVDQFDPAFFSIAPREAQTLDPQQRLLLEVCWETLEDAGQSPARFDGSATGVFVGIGNGDYARLQSRVYGLSTIDAHSGTGSLNSVAAGRVAHFLGLHGPTMAIDTACSSSLVAVHLAVQALRNGDCRAALAGGVNLILDPSTSIALSAMRALSADGYCKTFDQDADGYVRGEGCGMVLLKRLPEALEDGDSILAVIRGSSVNHDGRSNGLTAPHGPSQELVIRQALDDAQVDRQLISYVETHGTGTSLGDPIEVQALDAVFGGGRPKDVPLAIGSVKTNIGHLESAAGIASLIKVVQSLRHGQIPAHLHLQTPNPYIAWDQMAITVPTELTPWATVAGRRIAGVSSFGFSGTNAHLIVEQAPEPAERTIAHDRPLHLLPLSAKSKAALHELSRCYEPTLSSDVVDLGDVCHTAAAGRSHFAHRLAVVAGDPKQCRERLVAAREGRFTSGSAEGTVDEQKPLRVAFLFTGQGSQSVGMGRMLYETQPTFRRTLDECDEILRDELNPGLLEVLYGSNRQESLLHSTAYTQPALFAIEYALYKLWTSWGIRPSVVMGHSIGEYVAACAAGILSMPDALRLVATRGRLMQKLPPGGAMAAVAAAEAKVLSAMSDGAEDVSVAALNGPEQTVISGVAEAVQRVVARLAPEGIRSQSLEVSHAFHSVLMEPMLDEFGEACRAVTFSEPALPIVSNLHGRVSREEMTRAEYWQKQIRQPVRFAEGMAEMDRTGADVFLEIGPKPILVAMGKQCIPSREQLWLPSLRAGHDDWTVMLQSLAELYVRGADIDWMGFDRDYQRRKVALPHYPFQRKRYWLDDAKRGQTPQVSLAGDSKSADAADMEHSLWEIQWQPRSLLSQPLKRHNADYLVAPARLADLVRPEADRLRSQLALERYQRLASELDALSAEYVCAALGKIGCELPADETMTADALADRLGVVEPHRSLFARMLDIWSEERSRIVATSSSVRADQHSNGSRHDRARSGSARRADPEAHSASLLEQFPECSAELMLLRQCGQHLAAVLTGAADPLHVLFPSGSARMVEALYADSPFARTLNTLVEQTIAEMVQALPESRSLKILEIGAGTGGTTAQILPRLPADRTEYVFTDVSEVFTQDAQWKFRGYPFVRYGALDIELDPWRQGFVGQQFDIILAANVLHATNDLRTTLQHVRQLLAPRGALVLLEGTRPQRWLDLIFGLTDGWWRFTDRDLRPNHPLLSADKWTSLLIDSGFDSAVALPQRMPDQADTPQAVIVAQNSAAECDSRPVISEFAPAQSHAGSWLIFADHEGVGQRLAAELTERGAACIQIFNGSSYAQLDASQFCVRADQPEDLQRAIEAAWQTERPACHGVVHLWSLDAPVTDSMSVEEIDEATRLGCVSAIHAVQAVHRAQFSDSPRIYFITRGAQPVGEPASIRGLGQSPLWGLGRVLAEELPTMWGGLIDLDPSATTGQAVTCLLGELLQPDGEDQVGYRSDQRFAARLVRRPATTGIPRPVRWRSDASYLISGGLGDLGLTIARWMVEQGARSLVLFGRSPLPPRQDWDSLGRQDERQAARFAAIRELESHGARVKVAAADVAERASLSELFAEVEAEGWPPIRGVVHAAGVVEAQTLLQLDADQLARVLQPKVRGAWLLHELLADARLDFFIGFSSGAALLGSPMLGSYGAANAFLDALAHHRRAKGLPALTINWGFWDDVGMVARSQREIGRGFAPRGMQSFAPQQALAAMQRLLEQGALQVAVMPVDWKVWGESHPRAINAPLLSQLREQHASVLADESQVNGADERLDRQKLLDAAPEQRPQLVEEFLCRQLSRVLRTPVDDLDVKQPLNSLGIDSLMAVELRNQVEARLAVTLPVASLMQNPSITRLGAMLLDQFTSAHEVAPSKPVPGTTTAQEASWADDELEQLSANEMLAKLDELSDDEVERILNKMSE